MKNQKNKNWWFVKIYFESVQLSQTMHDSLRSCSNHIGSWKQTWNYSDSIFDHLLLLLSILFSSLLVAVVKLIFFVVTYWLRMRLFLLAHGSNESIPSPFCFSTETVLPMRALDNGSISAWLLLADNGSIRVVDVKDWSFWTWNVAVNWLHQSKIGILQQVIFYHDNTKRMSRCHGAYDFDFFVFISIITFSWHPFRSCCCTHDDGDYKWKLLLLQKNSKFTSHIHDRSRSVLIRENYEWLIILIDQKTTIHVYRMVHRMIS